MRVFRIHHFRDGVIDHAPGHDGNDFTLCGLALDGLGLRLSDDDAWSAAEDASGKVTCTECAKIVRYCKAIRSRELGGDKS